MGLGEGKKFIEDDWKGRAAYAFYGEPHIPGWIRLRHVPREVERLARGRAAIVTTWLRISRNGTRVGRFALCMLETACPPEHAE